MHMAASASWRERQAPARSNLSEMVGSAADDGYSQFT
jgi:hypothetical protein